MKNSFKTIVIGLLSLIGCIKTDLEDKSLTSSTDLNVRSVRTYYIDEFGDQTNKDGKLIGEAIFSDDGTLMNFESTYTFDNRYIDKSYWINEYSAIPINRLLWVLDGGFYGQQWKSIEPFLICNQDYPKQLGREISKSTIDGNFRPIGLDYTDVQVPATMPGAEYDYSIDNEQYPTLIKSSKMLEFDEINTAVEKLEQKIDYDESNRLISIVGNVEQNFTGTESKTIPINIRYSYDDLGYLVNYSNRNVQISILRNSSSQVEKIEILKDGSPLRWYTYSYLENNLRRSSQAYNSNGELEFTVDYVYEYYN